MNTNTYQAIIILCFLIFTSCVNRISDEDTSPSDIPASLNITTRTDIKDIPPTYPVHIYAFNETGKCAARQSLQNETDEIRLELAAGTYTVCAFTGANPEEYNLPAINEATIDNSITLKQEGNNHNELEAGKAIITLTEGETTDLFLTVSRVVSQVSAVINGIKNDVSAVEITVQPLYNHVKLNGLYSSESSDEARISLTSASNGTWQTAEPVYLLPGPENITVTVILTDASGPHRYAYNSTIQIDANYKISIKATYNEVSGPDINGHISGTDWAGERHIEFNFGSGTKPGNNDDNLPEIGDTYRGCYVLNVTYNPPSVLLVAPQQWEDLTPEETNPAIQNYETDGITGWKLPDRAEAELLFKAATFIPDMSKIKEYLFMDGETVRCFNFESNSFQPQKASVSGRYNSRAVKVLEI